MDKKGNKKSSKRTRTSKAVDRKTTLKSKAPFNPVSDFSDYDSPKIKKLWKNAALGFKLAVSELGPGWDSYGLQLLNKHWEKVLYPVEDAPVCNCHKAMEIKYVGQLIEIIGFISFISDPITQTGNYPDEPVMTYEYIKISDGRTEIQSCRMLPGTFKEITHLNVGKKFIFQGTVIQRYDKKTNKTTNLFYISNISSDIPLLKILRATSKERKTALDLVMDLRKRKIPLMNHIKQKVVEHFEILDLKHSPELDKAIDFTILQAFSYGRSSNHVNKIHSLVVGKPGRGKKLLTLIAKEINPISYEVSTDSKKVTSAGLIGNVSKGKSGWTSQPGILPVSDGGIVCFQDAHYLKKDIHPILSKVMEDGEVEDSTAAKTTHTARVSIHVDLNRNSDLRDCGEQRLSLEDDFCLPRNIISRFDGIFHISSNTSEYIDHVLNQISNTHLIGNIVPSKDNLRELKILVAYVLDRNRAMERTIPTKSTDYIKAKIEDLINSYGDVYENEGAEILVTRLKNSVSKILLSLSIMRERLVDTDMIDECITILSTKFDILKKYFEQKPQSSVQDNISQRRGMIEELIRKRKEVTFSAADLQVELKNEGIKVSDKTIKRDLSRLKEEGKIEKKAHNVWVRL